MLLLLLQAMQLLPYFLIYLETLTVNDLFMNFHDLHPVFLALDDNDN